MLAALRSLLRWSFAFTAMFLLPTAIYAPTRLSGARPLSTCGISAVFLAIGLLFAMACWTTRKSSATPNGWAIAASLINIATGLFILRYIGHFKFASPEPLLIAAGLAGLFVFSRRPSASAPVAASTRSAPVPGDRTSLWFDRLSTVIFTIATWVAMSAWHPWARVHHLPTVSGIALLLLIATVALVTAVLHECGHALVAYAFQMRLLGFNAGPFQWRKRQGRWNLQFKSSGILGGAVHVVPTNPDQPRWHDVCMVAAGPLVNICTAPLFLWAALHAPATHWQPAWFFLAMMSSFALLVAAFNLFPFRTATGSYSDGARILQLLTRSPVLELHRTMRRVQSTLVTSLRFRDLDPVALQHVARRYPRELTGLQLGLFAAQSFEDLGQLAEARAALAEAEAIYTDSTDLPVPLHTIFVFQHACLNRDAATARLWWNRMLEKKPERHDVDYWIARTALLWIEGRIHDAEQAWQNAAAEAQVLPHFGAYELDRSRCTLLRRQLDRPAQTVERPDSSNHANLVFAAISV